MEYPVKIVASTEKQAFDRECVAQAVGKEKLLKIYENMVRVREFDNAIAFLMQRGVAIIQHSTRGQEATPIVATAYLDAKDYVMPYHRGWGWAIGKGMKTDLMMAELVCKRSGYNHGRAGSQLGDYDLRIMGRPGIQGAHISVGTGIAFAEKLKKTGQICLCMCGNGASNSGNFYEAMNMGATFKVPILYIVENNTYEIEEHITSTTAVEDIALRGPGVGTPSYIVDGNDVIMLCQVIGEAYDYIRAGKGPVLLESKTYRIEGHMQGDMRHRGGYRSIEEIDQWEAKDPIARLEKDLLDLNMATEADFEAIHAAALEEMEKAKAFSEEDSFPEKEELLLWNYVE